MFGVVTRRRRLRDKVERLRAQRDAVWAESEAARAEHEQMQEAARRVCPPAPSAACKEAQRAASAQYRDVYMALFNEGHQVSNRLREAERDLDQYGE